MKWNTLSNKIRNNQHAQPVCDPLRTEAYRPSFVLLAYHDHYKKPYHFTQYATQQQKWYSDSEPIFSSFPLHRMGCQEHRFAKLRSKPVPRTGFPSFVLLLTAHAPIYLENINTPHAMTGNPAPIMALTPPPNNLFERTYSLH